MKHVRCPTDVVNAPVELVWTLLTHPEGWGDFYDIRITAADPAGPAIVGQRIYAESGPRFLHLKLLFQFVEIDALNYQLAFHAQFPFDVSVRERMSCVPLGQQHCRVHYNCGFGFPTGRRGAMVYLLLRRKLDSGPADSLARLKRHAERLYAQSPSVLSAGPVRSS